MTSREPDGGSPDESGTGESFGRALRLRREERGLSRQQVAMELRLTGTTVQWIEEENLDRLPPEVYVKGFLREYAKLVEADPEQVLAQYMSNPGRKIPVDEARNVSARRKRLFLILVVIAILLGIVFLARAMAGRDRPAAPAPGPEPAARMQAPAPAMEVPLQVTVRAEEDAEVKVMADGGEPVRHALRKGQNLSLSARKDLNLLVADPGSVTIFRDGVPVALCGRPGQPANVRIP